MTFPLDNLGEMPPFTVKPYFNKDDDSVICYLKDEHSYEQWITPDISVFRSIETEEIIGFEINGITSLVGQL